MTHINGGLEQIFSDRNKGAELKTRNEPRGIRMIPRNSLLTFLSATLASDLEVY